MTYMIIKVWGERLRRGLIFGGDGKRKSKVHIVDNVGGTLRLRRRQIVFSSSLLMSGIGKVITRVAGLMRLNE